MAENVGMSDEEEDSLVPVTIRFERGEYAFAREQAQARYGRRGFSAYIRGLVKDHQMEVARGKETRAAWRL